MTNRNLLNRKPHLSTVGRLSILGIGFASMLLLALFGFGAAIGA